MRVSLQGAKAESYYYQQVLSGNLKNLNLTQSKEEQAEMGGRVRSDNGVLCVELRELEFDFKFKNLR